MNLVRRTTEGAAKHTHAKATMCGGNVLCILVDANSAAREISSVSSADIAWVHSGTSPHDSGSLSAARISEIDGGGSELRIADAEDMMLSVVMYVFRVSISSEDT